MPEELVSQAEYMRRYKIGYERMKRMIYNKEVEVKDNKIVIKNNNSVSLEVYEAEKERRIKAEQKLEMIEQRIGNLLEEVR